MEVKTTAVETSAHLLARLGLTVAVSLAVATPAVVAAEPPGPQITSDQAAAIGINRVETTDDGVLLSHPRYHVDFQADGIMVTSRGAPQWGWRLCGVMVGDSPFALADVNPVIPVESAPRIIDYDRSAIIERYVAHSDSVEQRFVIPEPLGMTGDLVIEGRVETDGEFRTLSEGWAWSHDQGQVTLGDVTVFDAAGETLSAAMEVAANSTRIVVSAGDLARAVYPVIIDPEIGVNDFRISDMGVNDGDALFDALRPAVTWNAVSNEYLVVWRGDDDAGSLANDEFEIYAQRLSASGVEVGTDFRISDMGPDGDADFDAFGPAVTWNATDNEYLVVWWGNDTVGGPTGSDDEYEIHGQRLSDAGVEIGADFRISDMGPVGNPDFGAFDPVVAWSAASNEYLVVWDGDDDTGLLMDDEFEIYGQRLSASGAEVGAGDFRISDMGPDGDPNFGAFDPAVIWSAASNEYLVVWSGEDNAAGLAQFEAEIYGQRLSATEAEIGSDFRISSMGPDGNAAFDAFEPAVSWSAASNEYLVVWSGDDAGALADDEFEIYGQLLGSTGNEIGADDFRISDMGAIDGDAAFEAIRPATAWSAASNEFVVVWRGNDGTGALADGEYEIYSQRLDPSGAEIDPNDLRISDMGPDGDPAFDVGGIALDSLSILGPSVAHSVAANEYLVVWQGDDDMGSLADDEFEIYGQLIGTSSGSIFVPPSLSGWTYFSVSTAGSVLGADFPGDVQATGVAAVDNDGDASTVDLILDIGTTDGGSGPLASVLGGDSFHWFQSPGGLIPFVEGGTYRLQWTVSSSLTGATGADLRTRYLYGFTGAMGNGNQVASGRVAPPGSGTVYTQVFDQLSVASASDDLGGFAENDIQLSFEQIDLLALTEGDLELDNLVIELLDKSVIIAAAAIEFSVSDFSTDTAEVSGATLSGNTVSVNRTAGNAVISAPTDNGTPGITVYGDTVVALTEGGIGVAPFAPSATTGLIYRAVFGVDSSGNVGALPILSIRLQTFSAALGSPLYTSETQVNSNRTGGGPGAVNPAYQGPNTYAGYLVLPSGLDLDGMDPDGAGPLLGVGDQITATVQLQDPDSVVGGNVTVTELTVTSFPESLLP